MKKSEIKIGEVYSNGKGRSRKVIDIGPQYKFYDGQECTENLQYEIVEDGTKKNLSSGNRRNMTIVSFATWAKSIVND